MGALNSLSHVFIPVTILFSLLPLDVSADVCLLTQVLSQEAQACTVDTKSVMNIIDYGSLNGVPLLRPPLKVLWWRAGLHQ